jgi:hypothetical protein
MKGTPGCCVCSSASVVVQVLWSNVAGLVLRLVNPSGFWHTVVLTSGGNMCLASQVQQKY